MKATSTRWVENSRCIMTGCAAALPRHRPYSMPEPAGEHRILFPARCPIPAGRRDRWRKAMARLQMRFRTQLMRSAPFLLSGIAKSRMRRKTRKLLRAIRAPEMPLWSMLRNPAIKLCSLHRRRSPWQHKLRALQNHRCKRQRSLKLCRPQPELTCRKVVRRQRNLRSRDRLRGRRLPLSRNLQQASRTRNTRLSPKNSKPQLKLIENVTVRVAQCCDPGAFPKDVCMDERKVSLLRSGGLCQRRFLRFGT